MPWDDILGHQQAIDRFRTSIQGGRLASTFLFVGKPGIGKATFARKLAQALLCETNDELLLDPCGYCPACQQASAGSHPDLILISKPDEKTYIPIELFIGDREHRMREGMCHDISLKPYRGGRKVAIIDDADFLNQEGANCLLKTLEEPPPHSMIILIGSSEQRQLPTIRSRSQIVRFHPLDDAIVAQLLEKHQLLGDEFSGSYLDVAAAGEGSLQQAIELAGDEMAEFRTQLLSELSDPRRHNVELAKNVIAFVDAAGKDSQPRRARLRSVVGLATDFYRQLMRRMSGLAVTGDALTNKSVERAANGWQGDAERAGDCVERCMQTIGMIQANANVSLVIECWFDDLWLIENGRKAESVNQ
ncbi:MAG: DNA polymerase-3 subunit delta' [Pirellulaceae bacterium]|jgi:DNA polymerase-3 subunit delta'